MGEAAQREDLANVTLCVTGEYEHGGVRLELDTDELEEMEGKQFERIVDVDLQAFNEFYAKLDNGGLVGPEVALLKTYLWYKAHPNEVRKMLGK